MRDRDEVLQPEDAHCVQGCFYSSAPCRGSSAEGSWFPAWTCPRFSKMQIPNVGKAAVAVCVSGVGWQDWSGAGKYWGWCWGPSLRDCLGRVTALGWGWHWRCSLGDSLGQVTALGWHCRPCPRCLLWVWLLKSPFPTRISPSLWSGAVWDFITESQAGRCWRRPYSSLHPGCGQGHPPLP